MDRKEALQTFGLEGAFDADDLDDALDEQLFLIKKNVLSKYLAPALLDKQLRIVSAVRDAYGLLTEATPLPLSKLHSEDPFASVHELIPFLERYESALSAAKLALQSARNTEQLHHAIHALKHVQENYMHRFIALWPGSAEENSVASRDALDTGVALRLLRSDAQAPALQAMLHKEAARIRALMA